MLEVHDQTPMEGWHVPKSMSHALRVWRGWRRGETAGVWRCSAMTVLRSRWPIIGNTSSETFLLRFQHDSYPILLNLQPFLPLM
jgi:hypothetical protein